MHYEPTEVEYLVRAKDAGLGECELANITLVIGGVREMARGQGEAEGSEDTEVTRDEARNEAGIVAGNAK